MTAGIMQLIAYGAQDVYLTGNPQITFFKVVYRRHTNFSIEAIEHQFAGEPGFNKRITAKITRNADLVNRVYIRVNIASINPEATKFAWIRRLGHALIRLVDIFIGGTRIDTHYGTWLDIWYELARFGNHEKGYARMIGDVPEMTTYNTDIKPEYILYIPLQFWFNRFVGLSVPIIALQYHDMTVSVEFNNAETLVIRDCNFDISKIIMNNATLLVDYIYLDTEERRRFAQVGHEYLIEQLQFNGNELVTDLVKLYRVDFNHPTKEIFWAVKNGNYTTGKEFIYYTNDDEWSVEDAACVIIEKSIAIDNDPTDIVGGIWQEVPGGDNITVGTLNINNTIFSSVWVNADSLKIGDYGITSKIIADVTIKDHDGNTIIDCLNVETTLTIRDLSIPIEFMEDTRFNKCDSIVYQFNNYGILIDGTLNPVEFSLLQLNGYDRFDRREGAYFNYVVPEKHHTNTPIDGINVYSFALFPEEHQPSGTANLSRIDRTDLTVWFKDPLQTTTNPSINFLNPENRLFIYGTNYNILRIFSGLGGLAYSVG